MWATEANKQAVARNKEVFATHLTPRGLLPYRAPRLRAGQGNQKRTNRDWLPMEIVRLEKSCIAGKREVALTHTGPNRPACPKPVHARAERAG